MCFPDTVIRRLFTALSSRAAGTTWSTIGLQKRADMFLNLLARHTRLSSPEGVEEMITYFQVNGVMCYVDPWGKVLGYEDVFTKIDMCRKHFAEVGLGEDFVDRFIR